MIIMRKLKKAIHCGRLMLKVFDWKELRIMSRCHQAKQLVQIFTVNN